MYYYEEENTEEATYAYEFNYLEYLNQKFDLQIDFKLNLFDLYYCYERKWEHDFSEEDPENLEGDLTDRDSQDTQDLIREGMVSHLNSIFEKLVKGEYDLKTLNEITYEFKEHEEYTGCFYVMATLHYE